MFDAAIYVNRRRQLMETVGSGQILLLGNEESPMNYAANHYPYFSQDSTFLYFTGLNLPGLHLLMDIPSGKSMLFGVDPDVAHMIWTGPQPRLAALAAQAGIEETAAISALKPALGDQVHVLPPYRGRHEIQLATLLDLSIDAISAAVSVPLIHAVIAQRAYKSEAEIREMAQALHVTRNMHLTAMQAAEPGMVEAEVMAAVFEQALAANSWPSYPIILSVHGEVLHNQTHHHTLESGQLVLMDGGATSPGKYVGDITRTFPVDAHFTIQQKEIYEIVLAAEEAAIAGLKPGVPYRDLHLAAAGVIAQGLTDLGLMKGDPQAAVAAGAHALFFPHGLGHMLGMDVHDMEGLGEDHVGYDKTYKRSNQFGLAALRLGRKLEQGFALTVEPGIYFIPMLIDQWQAEGKHGAFINYEALAAYRQFGGIRIEDNYWITENGSQLIGDPIPKTISEIEGIRGQALAHA